MKALRWNLIHSFQLRPNCPESTDKKILVLIRWRRSKWDLLTFNGASVSTTTEAIATNHRKKVNMAQPQFDPNRE